jgi:hypothetical protein
LSARHPLARPDVVDVDPPATGGGNRTPSRRGSSWSASSTFARNVTRRRDRAVFGYGFRPAVGEGAAADREHTAVEVDVGPVAVERLLRPHAGADAEDRQRPERPELDRHGVDLGPVHEGRELGARVLRVGDVAAECRVRRGSGSSSRRSCA